MSVYNKTYEIQVSACEKFSNCRYRKTVFWNDDLTNWIHDTTRRIAIKPTNTIIFQISHPNDPNFQSETTFKSLTFLKHYWQNEFLLHTFTHFLILTYFDLHSHLQTRMVCHSILYVHLHNFHQILTTWTHEFILFIYTLSIVSHIILLTSHYQSSFRADENEVSGALLLRLKLPVF